MPDAATPDAQRPMPDAEAVPPLLRGLNPVQREAVQHADGPMILFAGAGSGKTRVLTHRIAWLISERHVPPRHILAVTFTNKAAQEMKERIGRLFQKDAEAVAKYPWWLGTFHAVCARILREYGDRIGLERSFVIYDEGDQTTLVRECMRQLNLDETKFRPRAILARISEAKEKLVAPEDWNRHFVGFFEDLCGKVYPLYQEKLRQNNALDFDDLLMETVRLLETRADVLERLQERFRYILVDEYQDVNRVQYTLLKLLAAKHRNICVVGDPDQSIYQFRGADVSLILQFEQDYPDARVVLLEQNYRSTKTILDAAHGVVQNNRGRKEKRLWTENASGVPLVRYEAMNEQEEAVWIAQKMREEVTRKGRRWRDFAILYRTNAQSRPLEEAFVNWSTPYKIVGGIRFYERKEIKDILAYLRVLHNPADSISLRRILNVPARGLGATTLAALEEEMNLSGRALWEVLQDAGSLSQIQPRIRAKLAEFASLLAGLRAERETRAVTEITQAVLDRSGYRRALQEEGSIEAQTRLEYVDELLSKTQQFDLETDTPTLAGFLENVALVADIDSLDTDADAVTLMTLHSAKGLEFPVVFLIAMEENIFPHIRAIESDREKGGNRETEEERRLAYVGITRAREELYLTYANRRTLFGTIAYNPPSRFLREIPQELFHSSPASSGRGPAVSSFDPDEDEYAPRPQKQPAPAKKLWDAGPQSPRDAQRAAEASGYKVNQKVRHAQFGTGIIVKVSGTGDNTIVEVVFPSLGIKRLLLAYTKLEKLE
jgi:DNA helicase-2/ATP-dependent DNA helicase PcrA